MTDRVTGVLLAAGLSTRMGRPKALLDWCGRPLVAYQVDQLKAAGAGEVIVVTGHEGAAVAAAVAVTGARAVHNSNYDQGRASSVRSAADAVGGTPAYLVLLNVDQPRHAHVIRAVIDAHTRGGALITSPVWEGRRGHPLVIDGSLLAELRGVTEAEQGLRGLIARHAARRDDVPATDGEVLIDINDAEDYRRTLATWLP